MTEPALHSEPDFRNTLTADIDAAVATLKANNTPSNRRNAVRTIFAGIEGVFWALNETVYRARNLHGKMSHHERAAFEQRTHSIDKRGAVVDKPHFVAVPTGLRFVAAQLKKLTTDFRLDLSGDGFRCLVEAKEVRDCLAHPKTIPDLDVTDEDVAKAQKAFEWIMEGYTATITATLELPPPKADVRPEKMDPNPLLLADSVATFRERWATLLEDYTGPSGNVSFKIGPEGDAFKRAIENLGAGIKSIELKGPAIKPFKFDMTGYGGNIGIAGPVGSSEPIDTPKAKPSPSKLVIKPDKPDKA